MRLFEIKMPEMGDVGEVVVTDVLIQAKHHVAFDQPLIAIETDMATMQIPSPTSGIVHEIKVVCTQLWPRETQLCSLKTHCCPCC